MEIIRIMTGDFIIFLNRHARFETPCQGPLNGDVSKKRTANVLETTRNIKNLPFFYFSYLYDISRTDCFFDDMLRCKL